MSKRERLRRVLYFVQWLGFFSFVCLIVVFSLTGSMLELPSAAKQLEGSGFVAKYGMRPVLLLLFLAACAVDAICLILSRFARLYRYPVPVHSRNIEVQYLLAQTMYAIVQFAATIYCTFLMVQIYEMAIRLRSPSFLGLSLAAAAFITVDVAVYLYLAKRNR